MSTDPALLYPIQLLDVRLYQARVDRIDKSEEVEKTEQEVNVTPCLKVGVEVLKGEERRISTFLTMDITGPTEKHPEFHIHYVLEGLFESQVDIATLTDETWQEFERTSAITLLWPYAREYTHSFARRMRVELPVLPTLNRLAMRETASEEETEEEQEC